MVRKEILKKKIGATIVGEARSTKSISGYCPHPSNHFRDHSNVTITNISCPTYPKSNVCAILQETRQSFAIDAML